MRGHQLAASETLQMSLVTFLEVGGEKDSLKKDCKDLKLDQLLPHSHDYLITLSFPLKKSLFISGRSKHKAE